MVIFLSSTLDLPDTQGGCLDFDLDYSCFGNILLYLLYSAYPKSGKKIWYEELDLLPGQRAYLMRLLRLTEPFTSDTAVVEGFRKNFSIN